METRDQWYKPNLLYNIHWRPPKTPEIPKMSEQLNMPERPNMPEKPKMPEQPKMPEPLLAPETSKTSKRPKMSVKTIRFNPSFCTCGEHDCKPRYRMERKVVWVKKEGSKSIKENVEKEDEMEICEHGELQRLKQCDIKCLKVQKGDEEEEDSDENKTTDNVTEHNEMIVFRGNDNDRDYTELKAKFNNKSISDDKNGVGDLKTKGGDGNFDMRSDSLGYADKEVYSKYDNNSDSRRRCFTRERANENNGKRHVSFNTDAKNKDLKYDDENNVDCSEDLDRKAKELKKDGKGSDELCFYDFDRNGKCQKHVARELNSLNAAAVFDETNGINGLERNGEVGIAHDNHNGDKTKDSCEDDKMDVGCFDRKGDDEISNSSKYSKDFDDDKRGVCFSSNLKYRERNEISSGDNRQEYMKDCIGKNYWKEDHACRCDGIFEDSGESDLDLRLFNGDAHDKNGIQDDKQKFEDEISPAFGILSIYCNSDIHFMVESTRGRNTP